jgi:hypothetical protein
MVFIGGEALEGASLLAPSLNARFIHSIASK